MKKLLPALSLLFLLPGCLTFKTVEYTITVNKDLSATGVVIFRGIGSDVADPEQRKLDMEGLVEYGLKSTEFINDRKSEGREVRSRKLYVENGLLTAEIGFSVKKVSDIEGIYVNEEYIYVDVDPDSQLNHANGEINTYGGGSQVLWKKGPGKLTFAVSVYTDEQWPPFSLTQEYLARYGSKGTGTSK